jgi:hypothetical protein
MAYRRFIALWSHGGGDVMTQLRHQIDLEKQMAGEP